MELEKDKLYISFHKPKHFSSVVDIWKIFTRRIYLQWSNFFI